MNRTVHARAPLRINDIGGWTDTWFAKQGNVLNLAVDPPVEVQIRVRENEEKTEERVLVHAENYGETFAVVPERPASRPHAFLQHTIAMVPLPREWRLEIDIFSPVPAGISTGTSASVCVALIGALNFLAGVQAAPDEIAALAHRVETEKLSQQSGIQDQICAARGGVTYIRMFDYPRAEITRLELAPSIWEELDRRTCLVYLGKPHNSSAIHEEVIARLAEGSPLFGQIETMKKLAEEARDHLLRGDLESYGRVMSENNECQRGLYGELISPEADLVIETVRRYGASGWKVNGAGGHGGSLTVLAGQDDGLRRRMVEAIISLGGGIRVLPASLSIAGLRVWEVGVKPTILTFRC
jgi:D-glycero-alpha-D-manno-heptose-7-phosphate kinase